MSDVSVIIAKEDLEEYTASISDILCWINGFKAAQPDDKNIGLYGVGDLMELNIKLKSELAKAEEQ